MNKIDQAKSIISQAAETISECKMLMDDEIFVQALADEIMEVNESKQQYKNTYVVFGVSRETGMPTLLGTTPLSGKVMQECACHVMVPVKASSTAVGSLKDKTYSTLTEIARSNGKNLDEFKHILDETVNTYISDNLTDIDSMTKEEWSTIAESIVLNHFLPKSEKPIELGDGDIRKLIENISAKKKKEATELLENTLKLDNEMKKGRLLDRLLKENKGEDI
jgi:hypothetical protein